jgi:PIN domain nuclease of toxin-antitoxin system
VGSRSVDFDILDTHVWIWLVNGGPERLLGGATDAIRRAYAESALAVFAVGSGNSGGS